MKDKIFLRVKEHFLAIILLTVMFGLMVSSSLDDVATADELAHIPAGYSYIATHEYRYNPEHPPLLKDLSAISLYLFMKPVFPMEYFKVTDSNYWGHQWGMGKVMAYYLNDHPTQFMFFARLPIMLLSLALGFAVYYYARKYYGKTAGLIALTFYVFAPNILAHSRYVTTDLGIAAFYFLGIVTFVEYLKKQSLRNYIIFVSMVLLAFLSKYSAVLLLPTLFLIWVGYSFMENEKVSFNFSKLKKTFLPLLGGLILVFVGILAFYWLHTENMTLDRVSNVIRDNFPSNKLGIADKLEAVSNYSRGLAIYLLGLALVFKHSSDGHMAFFLGETGSKGWPAFFPVVFALKTQIAFLVLTVISFVTIRFKKITLMDLALVIGIAVYFIFSIKNPMNIGIRHLLPVFPLLFMLVSRLGIVVDLYAKQIKAKKENHKKALVGLSVFVILMVSYVYDTLSYHPHYVAYFNQLIGDRNNAYKYFVDSSLDWGQDLKRLGQYVEKNKIEKITVDYFSGGPEVEDYVKNAVIFDKKTVPTGYFAVSATNFQFYKDRYKFLEGKEPVYEVGYSILIFKL